MDFCEGDEGFVCVGSSGKTAKVSAMPSPEKPSPLPPKKDKVPVLLYSLPNETALVTDSEDDSDANETFHDAETMPDEAHAPMPPSPLSPCRTCASGCTSGTACVDTRAAYSSRPSILILFRSYHTPSLPFTGPDTPLHHAGVFFLLFIDILIYF